MPKKVSRFSEALQLVFRDNEWHFPKSYIAGIYEERIKTLEAEIDKMKGERTRTRINPLEKAH